MFKIFTCDMIYHLFCHQLFKKHFSCYQFPDGKTRGLASTIFDQFLSVKILPVDSSSLGVLWSCLFLWTITITSTKIVGANTVTKAIKT